MPLPRRSPTADISRLINDLAVDEDPRRDAAIARLAVIGDRAAAKLVATALDEQAPARQRAGALQVLEGQGGRRGQAAALGLATADDPAVALAAIGVLGGALAGQDRLAARALDCLTGLALGADVAVERRLAALEALEHLPPRQRKTIHEALARDPASRIVARVTRHHAGVLVPLDELVEAGLPDDPELIAAVVREDASGAPITVLRRAVEAVRVRERDGTATDRPRWQAVRGQLHQELASRGSRLALYDVKESLEATTAPLPAGFVSAAAAVGDATCLAPLARAWVAGADAPPWWRDHLADAFQTIARRERLTRRHPAVVKVLRRLPAAAGIIK